MAARAEGLRVALFHTELARDGPGLLLRDILKAEDAQIGAVVRVLRHVDADILVLADVDYDLGGHALGALAEAIGGYPYRFAVRPNRGWPSGRDLDGDGRVRGAGDAQGYAEFSGQGGMGILSRFPVGTEAARDFSGLLWAELPGAIPPEGVDPGQRLSTTGHWDVPVTLPGGAVVHILAWHATPPVFDGPEDRNGRRNHDETAFWLRYLEGAMGAVPDRFVLMGAANLDPVDGDGRNGALRELLGHAALGDPQPASAGGRLAAEADGGVNRRQGGDPAFDTADWPEKPGYPGNMRVDYVLPSRTLRILDAGVFWPAPDALFGGDVVAASRHRVVWVDLEVESGGDGEQRIGGAEIGEKRVEAVGADAMRQ